MRKLLIGVVLLLPGCEIAQINAFYKCLRSDPVHIGMGPTQVKSSCLGAPYDVRAQTTARGRTDVWFWDAAYNSPGGAYVTFVDGTVVATSW